MTASTIAIDYGAQIAKRVIDDPTWFGQHLSNWVVVKGKNNNPEELHVEAGGDQEALDALSLSPSIVEDSTASFLPSNVNLFYPLPTLLPTIKGWEKGKGREFLLQL